MSEKPFVPAAGSDWLLPFYDVVSRLMGAEALHRRLLEQAGIEPGARVLEIGCGTGNLAILAKRLNPAAEVVGIDPDPKALARARRKARRGGIHVQLDRGFAEQLPFPDASFDRVLSALMLHHLQPDAKVLALGEARRVLKPGGSLHVADLGESGHASGGLLRGIARVHQALHGARRRFHGARHARQDESAILGVMRDAGFEEAQDVASQTSILGRIGYYKAERSA